MTAAIFDHFLPDPAAVRAHALAATYTDWPGPDGEIYRRICICDVPGLQGRIELAMGGPVDMLGMGYRLNYAAELPNAAIHSDLGWGTHALVLYLSDVGAGKSGTAFWRHRASRANRINNGDTALFDQVKGDWNRETAWTMTEFVPMKFNRALIYEGAYFHSRYPFAAFGDRPDNGRLIAVAFFTPRNQP